MTLDRLGVFPPPTSPLTEFEVPAPCERATVKSPKSIAFPCEAMVIVSIVVTRVGV